MKTNHPAPAPDPEAPLDAFRPEDLQDAVALAAELYRQDRERKAAVEATKEIGTPPEYLARAIATIQERNEQQLTGQQNRRASIHNLVTGVLAGITLVALLGPLALWWAPSPGGVVVAAPTPPSLPPGTSSSGVGNAVRTLKPLPSSAVKPSFRTLYYQRYKRITFQNTLNEPVGLYTIDYFNRPFFRGNIPSGGTVAHDTYMGAPWVVVDQKRKPLGMYFSMSEPVTARIERNAEAGPLTTTQIPEGYLKPASVGTVLPPLPRFSSVVPGIQFVNLTGKDVYLYLVGPAKEATWITMLPRYENAINANTHAGTLWIVTDTDQRVLETFIQPEQFSTALITPDVFH